MEIHRKNEENEICTKHSLKASNKIGTRGITLIALVVTIIVLLILAGISIQMLTGDNGILSRAGEAKVSANKAQEEEQIKLAILAAMTNEGGTLSESSLKSEIKSNLSGITDNDIVGDNKNGWTVKVGNKAYSISPDGNTNEAYWIKNANGDIDRIDGTVTGVKIGDKIYESFEGNASSRIVDGKEFDGQWRVLGVENGQLLLVSANYVSFTGNIISNGVPLMELQGTNGIDNEISRLNTLCAKFADGEKTENGRSIKMEDINQITGYNPMNHRTDPNDLTLKDIYGKNTSKQYGNNVTYTIKNDNNVWYKGDQAVTTETASTYTKFWKIGENSNITEPLTVKSTFYSYYPETLGSFPGSNVASGQTMEGVATTSAAYDMLFKTQSNKSYWIASPCVNAGGGYVGWGLFVYTYVGMFSNGALANSLNGTSTNRGGVRVVVSLKNNIQPSKGSTDSTTGISTYTI